MPRASDYDLCAFCPRLCRHVCPVAVGSGREAATPTHVMAGVWGWLQDQRSAPEAVTLASICTGCGACTAACKLSRPVDDLLREARGKAGATPACPPAPEPDGDATLVAVHTDERAWGPALSRHLGQPVATLEAHDHLGEALLDHPDVATRFAERLRDAVGERTLVVATIGALRAARAAGIDVVELSELVSPPDDRAAAPACGRGADPLAPQPELLACCGACEPLASAHPDLSEEVGADQARRLGDRAWWTPDARCGARLRRFGARITDPVDQLLALDPGPARSAP